ncbi:uncharacterized protein LOC124259504 [Haliotis rubra]|uniref:uncharacterized protein LOC124259504 n=1 Tax=Haliotis rubra TaxID=36100 RepID=UPI001EE6242C|nr:uncharacterized protein LOC124259504 [Haliotis rubra]
MVDLLNVYNISTITIFKRTDDWSGQLDLLKIEGFLGHPTLCPASSPKVCVNQMGSFTGTSKTVACEQEVMARYVNVSLDGTMTMCEVQVFGEGICYKNVQIQKRSEATKSFNHAKQFGFESHGVQQHLLQTQLYVLQLQQSDWGMPDRKWPGNFRFILRC